MRKQGQKYTYLGLRLRLRWCPLRMFELLSRTENHIRMRKFRRNFVLVDRVVLPKFWNFKSSGRKPLCSPSKSLLTLTVSSRLLAFRLSIENSGRGRIRFVQGIYSRLLTWPIIVHSIKRSESTKAIIKRSASAKVIQNNSKPSALKTNQIGIWW